MKRRPKAKPAWMNFASLNRSGIALVIATSLTSLGFAAQTSNTVVTSDAPVIKTIPVKKGWRATHEFTLDLVDSRLNNQPIPHFTAEYPNASEDEAYKAQFRYVRERITRDAIAGFKAGLTSKAGQQKFNTQSPMRGVLFRTGRVTADQPIAMSNYQKLMIETELGFQFSETIKQPIKDVNELKSKVAAVFPVIELPDLGFANPSNISAVDIIAANVASNLYIVGKPPNDFAIDWNTLSINLYHENTLINSGVGSDALEDQWQALLWLVNATVYEGWVIHPKHVLITGAIGKMLPAKPGNYRADFGVAGQIDFTIVE